MIRPAVHVGTSGWSYSWNPDGLDWYIKNSGLDTVELNMSFYRIPYQNMVKGWARKGKDLLWSVKVNRLITHVHRLNEKSYRIWNWFRDRFKPLEDTGNLKYYLFQLPPSAKPSDDLLDRLKRFAQMTRLGPRFALEGRNEDWFSDDIVSWARRLGITLVSVDAPDLPRCIMNSNGHIYLRIHGRYSWYSYDYSENELKEIRDRILSVGNVLSAYIYFNNDHAMLHNARAMRKLFGPNGHT